MKVGATVDFRAHLSAAPLKLVLRQRSGSNGSAFPRSSERGPIEALLAEQCHQNLSYFRAHLSAAPLKLVPERDIGEGEVVFPRSSERGPIEAPCPPCPGLQGWVRISALI